MKNIIIGVILKLVNESNEIIGSVRAREDNETVYISKLMVHPDYRKNGYGTMLLKERERCFPQKRYELYTSRKTLNNIRLY